MLLFIIGIVVGGLVTLVGLCCLAISKDKKPKCKFPEGVTIKPDGVHDMEPCDYMLAEKYANVTVEVLECKHCGDVKVGWYRQKKHCFNGK